MPYLDEKDIKRLTDDPVSFAMLMDDHQLEEIIAAFVSVLNKRNQD